MAPPTPDNLATRTCARALDLIHHIDTLQSQIRLAEQGLDLLGWHAFSVAYSIGDPDDDTKPTPSEMKAFAHQIACMEIDIRAASAHAEKLLPICTQMMER